MPFSGFKSAITTFEPCFAKISAMAFPIPEPEPVIIETRSFSN